MRERIKPKTSVDIRRAAEVFPSLACRVSWTMTDAIFQTGRDLYMTAVLGPGCRLDRRLKGIGVRR